MPNQTIQLILHYKYLILFFLAIAEGPIISMVSGLLMKIGGLQFFPAYLALMSGDLTGDVGWYMIGRYYGEPFIKRFGRYFSITDAMIDKIGAAFRRHQNKVLFLSKITMGLGFALATLMTAGMLRIPLKKYLAFNALGQTVHTGMLIFIGYFFGNLYLVIDKDLRMLSLAAFAVFISAALYGYSRYIRSRDLAGNI